MSSSCAAQWQDYCQYVGCQIVNKLNILSPKQDLCSLDLSFLRNAQIENLVLINLVSDLNLQTNYHTRRKCQREVTFVFFVRRKPIRSMTPEQYMDYFRIGNWECRNRYIHIDMD